MRLSTLPSRRPCRERGSPQRASLRRAWAGTRIAAVVLAAASGLLPGAAAAHDTWLAPLPAARPGELRLALGTGNRFPVQETAVARQLLAAAACRGGDGGLQDTPGAQVGKESPRAPGVLGVRGPAGAIRPLQPRREAAQALELALPAAGAALTCWARTAPLQITLPPDKVAVYLDEIRASEPVRQRAARLAARGVAWQERYTKHARLEWVDGEGELGGAGEHAAAPRPAPMALDIVPDRARPAVGQAWGATVLRDGEPLPRFSVEFVHADTGLGFWLRTDDAGRVRVRPSLPGAWLLRGTDLRPHPTQLDAWDSRFVTLAVQVAPGPRPVPDAVASREGSSATGAPAAR